MWPKVKLKNRQFHISENEIMKTFDWALELRKVAEQLIPLQNGVYFTHIIIHKVHTIDAKNYQLDYSPKLGALEGLLGFCEKKKAN